MANALIIVASIFEVIARKGNTPILAYTNQISPFNAIFENILLGLGSFLLPLYFCVRLRLSIRH